MAAKLTNSWDSLNIVQVSCFRDDVELDNIKNYVYGFVLPITAVEGVLSRNKHGKEVHKKRVTMLADWIGVQDLKKYCTVRIVNSYTPSEENGDTHTLFVPLNDPVAFLKGSLPEIQTKITSDLNNHLNLLTKNGLMLPSDYKISVIVRPNGNSFAFINFTKETVSFCQMGLLRLFLKNQFWGIIPEQQPMEIDARIQKSKQQPQQQRKNHQQRSQQKPRQSELDTNIEQWPTVEHSKRMHG